MPRRFAQVDVFSDTPYLGNPLAVVLDGDGLTGDQMQQFAAWTNLSETTFVVATTDPAADYAVRIFDTASELPFAGHPTLGTCHAWLAGGGRPRDGERIVQECGAGLVTVRRTANGLAFKSPHPFRSGPVDEALVRRIADVLRIERDAIVDTQWAANGPNWVVALLGSADAVLALEPGFVDFDLGVVGPYPPDRRRRSRSGRSSRRTARPRRTRSPGVSTERWRSGWCGPAAPRCRTSPARAARSVAPAASTSRQTRTARSGSRVRPRPA